MRLAVFSDIHGNSVALDAVLADIERQGGVDAYWVLGDLVAFGPDPVGVLERLERLENAAFVRGNTDRYLASGEIPFATEQLVAEPERLETVMEMMRNLAWTTGALDHTAWHEMFTALPLEQRLELPDGTRVLGVHAAPGTDDGEGIHPRLSDETLREILKPASADLVLVGHTHWPMDVIVDSTRLVNLGSASLGSLPDMRAKYTLIDADKNGHTLEHRRVEYDRAAVVAAIKQTHNPGGPFNLYALSGERRPFWSANMTREEAKRVGLPEAWGNA